MAALDQHPTVVAVRNRPSRPAPGRVSASWLREVCLAAGADDVGFVAIRSGEAENSLKSAFPHAMSRMSRSVHLSPKMSSAQATGHIDRRLARVMAAPADAAAP